MNVYFRGNNSVLMELNLPLPVFVLLLNFSSIQAPSALIVFFVSWRFKGINISGGLVVVLCFPEFLFCD